MNTQTLLSLVYCLLFSSALISQTTYTTEVLGVCGMCEVRIEKAANELPFIIDAEWDVTSFQLTATVSDNFDETALHNAITAVGHDTELKLAGTESYNNLHGCCKYRDAQVLIDHGIDPYNLTIHVSGVCDMCKERIEEAANSLSFVKASDYSVEQQELKIFFIPGENELSNVQAMDLIAKKVAGVGHDAGDYKASDEDYNNLHGCCKYRNEEVLKDHGMKLPSVSSTITGYAMEETEKGKQPLPFADIFTPDKKHFTSTDEKGYFELEVPADSVYVVINYVGYTPDTILARSGFENEVVLSNVGSLEEVVVTYDKKTSGVSSLNTIKTFKVDEGEFLKAACCNLAESFETLPAVDVAVTDAVTGTRQIKMLGLSGPNILYTREQIPFLNGLSSTQGLNLIPGTWIEGMNLNQGIGSISDGYQSVSGQIDLELRKPESMDPVFLNIYGNEGGRFEANAHLAHRFSEKLSTGLLLHGNIRNRELDRNNDGFQDATTGNGFIALNRWKYHSQKNLMGQAGIKYANSNTNAGQLTSLEVPRLWRSNTNIREIQAWAKAGYILPNSPNSSVAIRLGANSFEQQSSYGNRTYDGTQDNFHAKLLYQGIIGNPNHKIRTGLGLDIENTEEQLQELNFIKSEVVPSAFAEYTLDIGNAFSAVAGLRYDIHNIYEDFLTPRLHLRYSFDFGLDLRAAAGQARRMPSVIAENISFLASARSLQLNSDQSFQPYGLPMIKSNNFSVSADYNWVLFDNEASLGLDYFHTAFDENIIVDMDADINQLQIYAQNGRSLSQNLQAQFDFRPVDRLDIRLAYKWQQLQLGYEDGLRLAPFTPSDRGFLNAAYETKNKWAFDITFNLTGPQRIPDTDALPGSKQMDAQSPTFLTINSQVSKEFFPGFTAYMGVENLTNYQQEYAIINAEAPFSDNFDASLIWGPMMGRNVYLGIRYTIVEFEEDKF